MLSQKLRAIAERLAGMQEEIRTLQEELCAAEKDWPDFQIVKGAKWKTRKERLPASGQVWTSDGTRVWLIHADGGYIRPEATACKFWTEAFVPAPPIEDAVVLYDLAAIEHQPSDDF